MVIIVMVLVYSYCNRSLPFLFVGCCKEKKGTRKKLHHIYTSTPEPSLSATLSPIIVLALHRSHRELRVSPSSSKPESHSAVELEALDVLSRGRASELGASELDSCVLESPDLSGLGSSSTSMLSLESVSSVESVLST